jgi:methionine synthase II (cobalamin-independent)
LVCYNFQELELTLFRGSFFPGLDGFEEIQSPDINIFRMYVPDIAAFTESGHKPGETVMCTGKIKHIGSTYVDQFNYLKNLLPKERQHEAKLTLAAPNWYHLRYKTGLAYPKSVYGSDTEYFSDIAKAYRAELKILYDNGCRNVQFDDPNLAYFCSEKMLKGFKDNNEDADQLLDSYIKLYNDCLSERPADFHVGVHLCRGNFVGGRHFSEGGYDAIATKLFNTLTVDTLYLEYDSARAGGFEPLKHLPKGKNVILGLITSKFPELENLDEMKKKVYQAAELISQGTGESKEEALNRLGVSPQCGFASHSDGNNVDKEDMIKKLQLVRKLADDIWPGQP